jgi:hypothetical protein
MIPAKEFKTREWKFSTSLMQPAGNKLDLFFIPLNDRFVNPSKNNPEQLV